MVRGHDSGGENLGQAEAVSLARGPHVDSLGVSPRPSRPTISPSTRMGPQGPRPKAE